MWTEVESRPGDTIIGTLVAVQETSFYFQKHIKNSGKVTPELC